MFLNLWRTRVLWCAFSFFPSLKAEAAAGFVTWPRGAGRSLRSWPMTRRHSRCKSTTPLFTQAQSKSLSLQLLLLSSCSYFLSTEQGSTQRHLYRCGSTRSRSPEPQAEKSTYIAFILFLPLESPPWTHPRGNVSAAPSSGPSATTLTRSSAPVCSTFSSTAEVWVTTFYFLGVAASSPSLKVLIRNTALTRHSGSGLGPGGPGSKGGCMDGWIAGWVRPFFPPSIHLSIIQP